MKRWFLLVLVVILLVIAPKMCSGQALHMYTDDARHAVERTGTVVFTPVLSGVVLDPVVIGSAWAVKRGKSYRIVTAQHVGVATAALPGVLQICSITNDCVIVSALEGSGPILSVDVAYDWMFWVVDELPEGMKSSKLSKTPRIGDRVCTSGAPLGRAGEYTCGQVTNLDERIFRVDARILPGNSGGPVFDDSGKVIGMVVAIDHPEEQGLGPVPTSGMILSSDYIWL